VSERRIGLERELSDGVVAIRPATPHDAATIVAGRDDVSRRFLGEGDPEPRPVACVVVDGALVGWVDYDHDRFWLEPEEVNVGYQLFPEARGQGYASRAVTLLLEHLRDDTDWDVATLLIHPENQRSLALARRLGFDSAGDLDGNPYWKTNVSRVG
jgi:RimJ/RimL family protein N-acetyltransferase